MRAITPKGMDGPAALDNIGGGIGRLPDEATRKRMAALIDSFPEPKPQPNPAAEAAKAPGIVLSTRAQRSAFRIREGRSSSFRLMRRGK